jgi:hypothetical protein
MQNDASSIGLADSTQTKEDFNYVQRPVFKPEDIPPQPDDQALAMLPHGPVSAQAEVNPYEEEEEQLEEDEPEPWDLNMEGRHQLQVLTCPASLGDVFEGYILCFNYNLLYFLYAVCWATFLAFATWRMKRKCPYYPKHPMCVYGWFAVVMNVIIAVLILLLSVMLLVSAIRWTRVRGAIIAVTMIGILIPSFLLSVLSTMPARPVLMDVVLNLGVLLWWITVAAYNVSWLCCLFRSTREEIEDALQEASSFRERRSNIKGFPWWVRDAMFMDAWSCIKDATPLSESDDDGKVRWRGKTLKLVPREGSRRDLH